MIDVVNYGLLEFKIYGNNNSANSCMKSWHTRTLMLRDSLARKWSTSHNQNAQLFAQHDAGLDIKPYISGAHVEETRFVLGESRSGQPVRE
jgi:hypothetical protein